MIKGFSVTQVLGSFGITPSAGALSLSGQSLTGSSANSVLDLSATWNTTGAPTAIKLNITNTASSSSSLLMDLQTGGTSRFRINRSGDIVWTTGLLRWGGSGYLKFEDAGGDPRWRFDNTGIHAERATLNIYASGTDGSIGFETYPSIAVYNAIGVLYTDNSNAGMRLRYRSGGSTLEGARLTSVGNFKIGGTADRATTVGTRSLDIFNGTAPAGTLANGISIYSDAGEAYVMDAAGNSTLISPHDSETNEWIFRSTHTPTGKRLRIDVERVLRFVDQHFNLDAVHEAVA